MIEEPSGIVSVVAAEHGGPVCELLDLILGVDAEDVGVREY